MGKVILDRLERLTFFFAFRPRLLSAICIFSCALLYSADVALAQEVGPPGGGGGGGGSAGDVFKKYACLLLGEVMQKSFGAMLTAVTGVLALVAAAMGSFKGAWLLVFVTVGTYIFPALVALMFPNLQCAI